MRLKTGWVSSYEYVIVKPLHNGCRQSLIMGAINEGCGRWYIYGGVFSSYTTYDSMLRSDVWHNPTSTNKKPSVKVISLALETLSEIEEEIHFYACGEKAVIYVDGLDKRRLRIYTKILTKRCGYKVSTVKSAAVADCPIVYKEV